jgi:hypothetical protein
MKKVFMFGLLLVATSNVFAIPMLTEASATGITIKFTAKLSEILPKGYKVKIDLKNGKGFIAMTCLRLACSLSSNALPIGNSSLSGNVLPIGSISANYKIGIYDSKGVLQGNLINGIYVIKYTEEIY